MGNDDLAERTCIVTRQVLDPSQLIRFVADPEGLVVPDLKHTLPGRGAWVTAKRSLVDEAVQKAAFSRGLKQNIKADPGLGELVDKLLEKSALGALGFARKAGECVTGSGKTEDMIRSGKAIGVLHALDGSDDGLRKVSQAVHASARDGWPKIGIWRVFNNAQLNMALGATNVIHAALGKGGAAKNCMRCVEQLSKYREMEPS